MDYDSNAPRTPPRNERTNDPFTPVSSLVPTVVDDMSPHIIQAITEQANRHAENRLYKKVLISDMIILNQLGQVVNNLYKLVPFTSEDRRALNDGLWNDHIYNMYGVNTTAQHQVETSHNQDITTTIFNTNYDSGSGSGQNPKETKTRRWKKNTQKEQ